jgi:hypothetical protein
MSFETVFKMKGWWTAELRGPDGSVKDTRAGSNVVVTNGKEYLASFLQSASVAASTFTMRYVAIGTDATAEAASNTALGTEVARTTGTASYISGQIYQVRATFGTGVGTGAITEYGLFSSSSAGTMLARDTEAPINKGANDTLTVTAQITIS